MTLRVTLEIIPFGEEENKYPIRVINISNVTFNEGVKGGPSIYVVEEDSYKAFNDETTRVTHDRSWGAEVLVRRALEALGY